MIPAQVESAAGRSRLAFRTLLIESTHRTLQDARCVGTPNAALRALARIYRSFRSDDLYSALRQADQLFRTAPRSSEPLESVYARLLVLEGRDLDAAMLLLRRIGAPDPDVPALIAYVQALQDSYGEAGKTLSAALADFSIEPNCLLAHVANEFIKRPEINLAGWIGRTSNLEFVGYFKAAETLNSLQVRLRNGSEFLQPIKPSRTLGGHCFHFKPPQVYSNESLQILSHGTPLLGGDCSGTPNFGLDGRANHTGSTLSGWARFKWLARARIELTVEDELGNRASIETAPKQQRWFCQSFSVNTRGHGLRGSALHVKALLPNGLWQALPDSPLLLQAAMRSRGSKKSQLSRWRPTADSQILKISAKRRAHLDVIIPVYGNRRHALACIHSAMATLTPQTEIVVVDDASKDRELVAELDSLFKAKRIFLLRNSANLGFVRSVNRALAFHPCRDAVLLNSDTLVFGDWLARLRNAAYSARKVGTITPLTNNGSIASYPQLSDSPMPSEVAAGYHELAAATNDGVRLQIPTGVGFCLYIRRDCLSEVGAFDARVFGDGYGEETDFCLRAASQGWSHFLAADVFVYHTGAGSFGARRAALVDRSHRLLNLLHPGFDSYIADFLAKDPLICIKRRLDECRILALLGRYALLVTLALPGGVNRYVTERCRALRAQGITPLILRPTAGNLHRCELWTEALDVPNLQYDIPVDLDNLAKILRGLKFESIEIQHFLGLDSRVIELVRHLGPYEVVVHDYAWMCPRITLINGSGSYCGEPDINTCESCVKKNGTNLTETISVKALRARSETWLRQAHRVATPSQDAATRLKRYFNTEIEVRPHTSRSPRATELMPLSAAVPNLRVALIGAIAIHKGYRVLHSCAIDAKTRNLPIEFVVIGFTENDERLQHTGKVFITGQFGDGELSHLLRRERPHLIMLPSVWPETWSYVLDDALETGLLVAAFDIGAIAERLRALDTGILLPMGMKPRDINDKLLSLVPQVALDLPRDMDIMRNIGERTLNKPVAGTSTQPDALSASVQMLPLATGLYLFSVNVAPAASRIQGQLQLPAMHVGLGPGVRADQVEFIAGPSTDGGWLFAQGDCLIAKVRGDGAALILTSLRGAGGETLSIKVERLDGRVDPAALSRAALPPDPAVAVLPSAVAGSGGSQRASNPKVRTASKQTASPVDELEPLALQIGAHIRARGDMTFSDVPWAGRVGAGLWMESFSIRPLSPQLDAGDIEYKSLTGGGFETPWVTDAAMCGTKQMAVPLVGFAIRLKHGRKTQDYQCEYSGFFKSGIIVGPISNGAPCRSAVANDPLEGIQVMIRKRSPVSIKLKGTPVQNAGFQRSPQNGPLFGRYRDPQAPTENAPADNSLDHKKNGGTRRVTARSTRRS